MYTIKYTGEFKRQMKHALRPVQQEIQEVTNHLFIDGISRRIGGVVYIIKVLSGFQ